MRPYLINQIIQCIAIAMLFDRLSIGGRVSSVRQQPPDGAASISAESRRTGGERVRGSARLAAHRL